ncbi:hypothetical protein CR513_18060, partial [Mucuna pruriens]
MAANSWNNMLLDGRNIIANKEGTINLGKALVLRNDSNPDEVLTICQRKKNEWLCINGISSSIHNELVWYIQIITYEQ